MLIVVCENHGSQPVDSTKQGSSRSSRYEHLRGSRLFCQAYPVSEGTRVTFEMERTDFDLAFSCPICFCPSINIVFGSCQHYLCSQCLYDDLDDSLRSTLSKCPICKRPNAFPPSRVCPAAKKAKKESRPPAPRPATPRPATSRPETPPLRPLGSRGIMVTKLISGRSRGTASRSSSSRK